jgi:hypothetical protein
MREDPRDHRRFEYGRDDLVSSPPQLRQCWTSHQGARKPPVVNVASWPGGRWGATPKCQHLAAHDAGAEDAETEGA